MTSRPLLKSLAVLTLFVLILAPVVSAATDQKVRVKVTSANVRLKPALDAAVVGKARQGEVLNFKKKTGDWYLVGLAPDEKGNVVTGFIHSSVVAEVQPEEAAPAAALKPKTKPEEALEPRKAAPPAAVERRAPDRDIPQTSRPAFRRLYLRLGGGYGQKKSNYGGNWAFDYQHEQGYVNEAYRLDSSGMAIDVGLGFLFTPNIGVEASFVPASGKIAGAFEAGFPHPFYFNEYRVAAWDASDLKYGGNELNLDLVARFRVFGRLAVYLTAGGTYFLSTKIGSLSALNYGEVGYPFTEISVTPVYGEYKKSTFGFNGGGGLDFFLTDMIAVNFNGRYTAGTAKIDVEGTAFEVKAGGIRATAGLKVAF